MSLNKVNISFILFLIISLSLVGWRLKENDLSSSAIKRIDKTLSKIWKGHDLKRDKIIIPDSIDDELNFVAQKNGIYSIGNTSETLGIMYVGRVKSCRIGGCASPFSNEKPTDHEHFDYMIIFEPTNLQVLKIEVLDYQATYGFEICSPSWLKQFIGYNGNSPLEYGGEIQALSGATISGIAITDDVAQVSKYMMDLREKELL